jgi:hypothetical protein
MAFFLPTTPGVGFNQLLQSKYLPMVTPKNYCTSFVPAGASATKGRILCCCCLSCFAIADAGPGLLLAYAQSCAR